MKEYIVSGFRPSQRIVFADNGATFRMCPATGESDRWREDNDRDTKHDQLHTFMIVDVEENKHMKAVVCDVCKAVSLLLNKGNQMITWDEYIETTQVFEAVNEYCNPRYMHMDSLRRDMDRRLAEERQIAEERERASRVEEQEQARQEESARPQEHVIHPMDELTAEFIRRNTNPTDSTTME